MKNVRTGGGPPRPPGRSGGGGAELGEHALDRSLEPGQVALLRSAAPRDIAERLRTDPGAALCQANDIALAVALEGERRVRLVSMPGLTPQWSSPELEGEPVSAIPVGPRVVAGTARGHLLAWNATSDAADPAPRDLAGHAGPVRALAADELYVFSGGDDGELVVRDAATLERRWALRGHARPIVKVIPAGGLVMSLDNATLLVWRRPERPAEPTPGPGPSATMAPKGTVVPTQSPTPSPEPRLVERRCGDGSCSPGESSALCCRDCGCPPGLVCTDGECVTEREAAVITPEPTEEVIVLDAGPSTAPSPAPAMPRVPPAAVGAALVIVVAAGAVAADSGWKR